MPPSTGEYTHYIVGELYKVRGITSDGLNCTPLTKPWKNKDNFVPRQIYSSGGNVEKI